MRRLLAGALTAGAAFVALSPAGGAAPPGAHIASPIRIPIVVVRARDGEAVAIAPVVISGHRYPFIIDTGSTRTTVSTSLARRLKLRALGRPIRIVGVGCVSVAQNVQLSNWRIAGKVLPDRFPVTSTAIAATGGHPVGLLGADVLSRYGTVLIDFRHAVMTLGVPTA